MAHGTVAACKPLIFQDSMKELCLTNTPVGPHVRWGRDGGGSACLPACWQHDDRLAVGPQHGTRQPVRAPAPLRGMRLDLFRTVSSTNVSG